MSKSASLGTVLRFEFQEGPTCRTRTIGASRLWNTRFGEGGGELWKLGGRIDRVRSTRMRDRRIIGRQYFWGGELDRSKVQRFRLERGG